MVLTTLVLSAMGCAQTVKSVAGKKRHIRIESNPSGAKVTYDGKPVGTTPTSLTFLEAYDTITLVRICHSSDLLSY